MNTKEILLTQGFGKSISNLKLDAEKVKNILNAKNATKFMEAVNAISDETNPYTESPTKTCLSSKCFMSSGVSAIEIIVPTAVDIPRIIILLALPSIAVAA